MEHADHSPGQRIVVIGGGPGGYEAALVAAQLGSYVTVIAHVQRVHKRMTRKRRTCSTHRYTPATGSSDSPLSSGKPG